MFTDGSDEHGQGREKAALNKTPQAYVDDYRQLQAYLKLLNISYDGYVRTTDDYHKKTVQKYSNCMIRATYINQYEGHCTLRIVLASS